MIGADTSAWIDYSKGIHSPGAKRLEMALSNGTLVMPMPVVFEIFSSPGLITEAEQAIQQLPQLKITSGFWLRAAAMRRKLLQKGLKARSMDCLIAQNCLDHDVPLIVADTDYRHFKKFGLKLV